MHMLTWLFRRTAFRRTLTMRGHVNTYRPVNAEGEGAVSSTDDPAGEQ
jgi:hypothetical protein